MIVNMKKPIINKLVLSFIAFGLLGTLTGCQKSSGPNSPDFAVWTTYSTAKVIEQTYKNDIFINNGASIDIKMMKDEYESSQLIITSKGRQTFDLIKTELVDSSSGKKIPEDKIEIYMQKYLQIDMNMHNPNSDLFDAGDNIPDMLLPMKYAKAKGENVTKANCNQGLSIEIDSYGLDAGTYEGTFTLKVGERSQDIPVKVTIWDFSLNGKSAMQSCWLIYSMYMYTGEYDASDAMLDTYSDFLSRYKANPYVIQEDIMNSPEGLMQDVKRMWNIHNYNSIIIPYDFPLNYNPDNSLMGDRAASYIVKIAEESTEENFYLDYALFYPSTYDEADAIPNKKAASPEFFKRGGNYEKTLEKAIQILTNKGYFIGKSPAWNERVKTAIRNIPDVFTNVNLAESWVKEWPSTFCPQINVVDSQKVQELYKDYAEINANNDFWTYTCCSPIYPYASHHLDDDCLSMRVMGWIEKSLNVNGYLFFMANMYARENDGSIYSSPYTSMDRNNSAHGDGYIMYPGRVYGSKEPFPSMRLVTYRDGLEDYEMLEVYEKKINALCEKYEISDIDSKQYVKDLYYSLFRGTIPTEDHHALYRAREELAKRILECDNPDDLLLNSKYEGEQGSLEIYTNSESLTIENKQVYGEDLGNNRYKYIYQLDDRSRDIAIITKTNNQYSYFHSGLKNITNFKNNGAQISLSDGSSYTNENGVIHANIVSYNDESASKVIRFVPRIAIKNVNLTNAKKLMFKYENNSALENLTFDVDLVSLTRSDNVGGHFCLTGKGKTIEIDLSRVKTNLSDVKEIDINFMNYYFDDNGDLQTFDLRQMALEDIFVTY